jgi:hypothetical protein
MININKSPLKTITLYKGTYEINKSMVPEPYYRKNPNANIFHFTIYQHSDGLIDLQWEENRIYIETYFSRNDIDNIKNQIINQFKNA